VPNLSADQAETTLSRLREADYPAEDQLVQSLIARLGEAGGVRRRNRAAKWFDPEASAREERRARRQQVGTVAEQKAAYRDYIESRAREVEAATKGQHLNPRARESGAISLEQLLVSNPATIRRHASEEALRHFAEAGVPLSFDAWRYANLGARDKRAVASWQRRTGSYFSEHG
jgi:hypothetical protein